MEFIKLAEERYSLRQFSDRKIEKEKLDLILEAGRIAPTACNIQPQRILVIESEEALAKIRRCTSNHFNAPVVLLVCFDRSLCWKRSFDGKSMGDVDASIVTTHMMLQAAELGLGTTWVGYFNPSLVLKEFTLPDNIVPVALLPLGYPAKNATKHPMHSQRNPIEKTVYYNKFQ